MFLQKKIPSPVLPEKGISCYLSLLSVIIQHLLLLSVVSAFSSAASSVLSSSLLSVSLLSVSSAAASSVSALSSKGITAPSYFSLMKSLISSDFSTSTRALNLIAVFVAFFDCDHIYIGLSLLQSRISHMQVHLFLLRILLPEHSFRLIPHKLSRL